MGGVLEFMKRSKTKAMETATQTKLRKNGRSKEDVHAKMTDGPNSAPMPQGETGRYVYGIVHAKDPVTFGKIGIGGSGEMAYTVNFQDIAAVVSNASVFIFAPTRENALAHEHVNETVMKNHTISPMSFGTVF